MEPKDLVDAAADSVHPRINRIGLNRLSDVPADRGLVEGIVLIEIHVVAVVTIDVVALILMASTVFSKLKSYQINLHRKSSRCP